MSADRNFARNYYYRLFGQSTGPAQPAAGQQAFVGGSGTPGRYQTFIVPDGIFFISAVVVSYTSQFNPTINSAGYVACRILRGGQNGTSLLSTSDTLNANGVGGGNGGNRGSDFQGDNSNSSPHANYFAGGGAGGYSGNGGRGGTGVTSGYGAAGTAGAGGGGGGGVSCAGNPPYYSGMQGGPVGLMGQGTNGLAGTRPTDNPGLGQGGTGSAVAGPYVGAGELRSAGGDLRWKNNIAVVPGEVLTIDLGTNTRNTTYNTGAGCRLMYGDARSYPNNAQNAIPQGQVIISGNADASWIVPAGVTSICVCAQENYRSDTNPVVLSRTGTVLVRAQYNNRVGDGGGDGGLCPGDFASGGGGAGGYDGNGGNGGGIVSTGSGTWEGQAGAAGTNSGQRGGDGSSNIKDTGPVFGGQQQTSTYYAATAGRSIGIKGKLANGSYYDNADGNSGGGSPGMSGGSLAWRNNIPVTPGEALNLSCRNGRIRIIYGPDRSYPNNAMDL